MDYSIKIDKFEGPMDLLLHLIKESNIDIYDISINDITKQYMDYLNKMEELNINIASSYLVMAAELMEIKSKSLLPHNNEESNEEDEEVSRENLINRLIEYKKYKEMTPIFRKMESGRQNIYVKSPSNMSEYYEEEFINNKEDVSLLVEAFKKYLSRIEKEKPVTTKIVNKEYSISDRKKSIKNILREKREVRFSELFKEYNVSYVVVTFLSLLELVKDREVSILQDRNFSDIVIKNMI